MFEPASLAMEIITQLLLNHECRVSTNDELGDQMLNIIRAVLRFDQLESILDRCSELFFKLREDIPSRLLGLLVEEIRAPFAQRLLFKDGLFGDMLQLSNTKELLSKLES